MSGNLLDLDSEALTALVAELGEKPFRARQLWDWLHWQRAGEWSAMRNLPATLKTRLAESGWAPRTLQVEKLRVSGDGLTEKWLFAAPDAAAEAGRTPVEAVLIRERRGRRRTVCVSTMSGCPLGCAFCATGQLGFRRNLTVGEIAEQVYLAEGRCQEADGAGLTNVVFMGMGEPLLNYEATLGALELLTAERGLHLGQRHFTISTVGVVPALWRLCGAALRPRLAVSLHASNQTVREGLIPAARQWPLVELFKALREYAQAASRRVTFEYCLIEGVNAGLDAARELKSLVRGLDCTFNLIPLNPTSGFAGRPPAPEVIRAFQDELAADGLGVTLRAEKGQDIGAACGQLGLEAEREA